MKLSPHFSLSEFESSATATAKGIDNTLKYSDAGDRVITNLKRLSKPGLRVYAPADKIPSVLHGLGVAILSTPNGLLTDKQARKANVGGEVLCFVW